MASEDHEPTERSVPDRFESLNLSIERIDKNYRARITDSPVGPTQTVPVEAATMDINSPNSNLVTGPTRDVRREPINRDDLRRHGERLFQAIFVGPIAENFRASVERLRSKGIGLRIRLQMDDAPELAALPWEALWDPKDRTFLNDQPDLLVARALNLTTKSPGNRLQKQPLRLLALLPEPRGESKISGADEWRQIEDRLSSSIEQGLIVADRLEPPTLEALGGRIDEAPCDVLHIVAHGGPGDPGGGGQLKLEDLSGGLDPVTGIDLARALESRTPPRLVVLNACHGAHAAIGDAFDGTAQHLLSRGVMAVVAMRTTVSDEAAVSFAVALYSALTKAKTIEAAMVEARRKLSLGAHRSEWSTPVLYLRGDNIRIFDTDTSVIPLHSSATRRVRRAAGAAMATLGLGALGFLGFLMWPEPPEDPCPTPPGLQDLKFVKIDPGVINLENGRIIVTDAYCISTKEVSRRDWKEVMGGDLPQPEWPPNWPITHVTPDDAEDFCNLLKSRDQEGVYSLPSVEQWQLAARAGKTTEYFFGPDEAELDKYGNCSNFLGRDQSDGPAAIGSYEPNSWGLYDVHGNVAEWVLWPAESEPQLDEPQLDEPQLDEPQVDGKKKQALRLGGSHRNKPRNCTFTSSWSEVGADDKSRDDTGFRVVRLPKER